ncbi:bifunctional DNA primase/polymerase (plasmid) [Streptomyces sp. Q6]|uniref:Bifunctional DNA primase/polymerase n=1 Tax=Streptomyces citrinus TaxID=3118173 RepID=A0ACD5AQZ7_9ACTN
MAPAAPAPPQAVARWFAAQGWAAHPLRAGRSLPVRSCHFSCSRGPHESASCFCFHTGRPCHGFHFATTDPELIERWWPDTRSAGPGVACVSEDLVVSGIGAHHVPVANRIHPLPGVSAPDQVELAAVSGFDTSALLAVQRSEHDPAYDEDTLRVRPSSGGLYVSYRNPDANTRYRCSTGSGRNMARGRQADVRAGRSLIVPRGTRMPKGVCRGGPSLSRAATSEGMDFSEKLNRVTCTACGPVGAGLELAASREQCVHAVHRAHPWQQSRDEQIVDDPLAVGSVRPLHLKGRS